MYTGGKGGKSCEGDLQSLRLYDWINASAFISQDRSLEEKDELHFVMFGINCPLGGVSQRLLSVQVWSVGAELEITIWLS